MPARKKSTSRSSTGRASKARASKSRSKSKTKAKSAAAKQPASAPSAKKRQQAKATARRRRPAKSGRGSKPVESELKATPPTSPESSGPRSTGKAGRRNTAADLAGKQRDISVSEFFAKNRHLLGFDNPSKALLTTVKEGVDNALDACEEAGISPDIRVEIEQKDESRFRIAIEDNGPGIVRRQVPKIFGRLLYGSKFHRLRQSRGQQGIGISAAGMYGLLTTGKPVRITTRVGKKKAAHLFELVMDTRTNSPKVRVDKEVEWNRDHGTRVEIELEGNYRGGQHSVDAYLRQISLANPHAELTYVPPRAEEFGDQHVFPRVTKELPPDTAEIKPHPYGVELGVLMQMFRDTRSRNVRSCLQSDFSRVSGRIADQILESAGVSPSRRPSEVTRAQADQIFKGIKATKIMNPPTDCIAPIGEELIAKALRAEVRSDFCATTTRRPTVYRGNPFLVEVGIAYGGDLTSDDSVVLYRYANRVPLQYQQGACAITKAMTSTNWRSYGLQHPRGALPIGPMLVMVHIASVWVPFTSESKEAIAHYPEIIKELKQGLQECGRQVATHVRRRAREADEAKKHAYIVKYIPQVAVGLQQILELSDKDRDKIVTNLTDELERSRKM